MDLSVGTRARTCIETARNAIYTKSDAVKAKQHLSALQESGRELQKVSEESKQQLLLKLKQLDADKCELQMQKSSYDCTIAELKRDRDRAQDRLESQRRDLSNREQELINARSRLSSAQDKLSKARKKEEAIKVASDGALVAGIVGGVMLGVFTFGVGGLVAGAAMGGAVSAAAARTFRTCPPHH